MAKAGVQFGKMKDLIKTEGPALVKQVKGVLQFDIKDGDAVRLFTLMFSQTSHEHTMRHLLLHRMNTFFFLCFG